MMKKNFLALLLAATCYTSVSAQKGMSGLGVNVPFAVGSTSVGASNRISKHSYTTTSLGIGVKYYYNISNYFRIEPSAEYMAFHSGGDKEYDYPMLKAFLNGHVFFASPRPARPYLIVGMGYVYYRQHVKVYNNTFVYGSYEDDGFCYNLGLGLDIRLSHSLSMQVEATGMSCLVCSNDLQNDSGYYNDRIHNGRWTFIAHVGLAYNF